MPMHCIPKPQAQISRLRAIHLGQVRGYQVGLKSNCMSSM